VNLKQRKRLRLADFEYTGGSYVYFLTLCTSHKQPYFADERIASVIENDMGFRRIKGEIVLYCYCIMPDHLHLLLSLTDHYNKRLQDWVSAFKRYTSRTTNDLYCVKPLWQRNFYDHIVRKKESLIKIAEYIVNNPVRKGMVDEWADYRHSKIFDDLL
jgi:REP element-mobilizing transposase RayT